MSEKLEIVGLASRTNINISLLVCFVISIEFRKMKFFKFVLFKDE